jgi:hypothetical protein
MLRLFTSRMIFLNASARFFRPSLVGGDARLPESALRSIHPAADRTLRDDLPHLKRLGLIDSRGHGRGAVWFLGAAQKLEGEPHKAE